MVSILGGCRDAMSTRPLHTRQQRRQDDWVQCEEVFESAETAGRRREGALLASLGSGNSRVVTATGRWGFGSRRDCTHIVTHDPHERSLTLSTTALRHAEHHCHKITERVELQCNNRSRLRGATRLCPSPRVCACGKQARLETGQRTRQTITHSVRRLYPNPSICSNRLLVTRTHS